MLTVIRSLRELHFGRLMDVYAQTNREVGRERWPMEPENHSIALAEQDFYNYLSACFFRTPGAVYCVWQESGRYVSTLRLEPWRDGLLLEGLETAPERRNHGYACILIRAVQARLREQGAVKVYSHISKRNIVSIAVHEKCGFRKLHDYAVYADGSVDSRSGTYIYEA